MNLRIIFIGLRYLFFTSSLFAQLPDFIYQSPVGESIEFIESYYGNVDCRVLKRGVNVTPQRASAAVQFQAIGVDYTPNSIVDVFITQGNTDVIIFHTSTETNGQGRFTVGFRVEDYVDPAVGGSFGCQAVERNGCAANTRFAVNGMTTLESNIHHHGLFQLDAIPNVILTGNNFSATERIVFTSSRNGREVVVGETRTDNRGAFRVARFYTRDNQTVFNIAGSHTIIATDESGNTAEDTIVTTWPTLYLFADGSTFHPDAAPFVGFGSEVIIQGERYRPNEVYQCILTFPDGCDMSFDVRTNGSGSFTLFIDPAILDPALLMRGIYTVTTDATEPNQTRRFTFVEEAGPNAADLVIKAIEVTQGIQDLAHTVPLIRRKRTWVRVYVEVMNQPIDGVTGFLSASKNGQPIVVSTGNPEQPTVPVLQPFCHGDPNGAMPCDNNFNYRMNVIPGDFDRGNLEQSFNFKIPYDWIRTPGKITFTARVYCQEPQSNYNNDTKSLTVSFLPTNALGFTRMRVHSHHPGEPVLNDPNYVHISNYVRNIYPLAHNDLKEWTSAHIVTPYLHLAHVGDEYDLRSNGGWMAVIANMYWRARITSPPKGAPGFHFWYGMTGVDPKGRLAKVGKSNGPNTPVIGTQSWFPDLRESVAVGQYNAYDPFQGDPTRVDYWQHPIGGRTMAHEFGHLFGFCHINGDGCSNADGCANRSPNGPFIGEDSQVGIWGFGTHQNVPTVIEPRDTRDIMCYSNTRWINDRHYNKIHGRLNPCDGIANLKWRYVCISDPVTKYDSPEAAQRFCPDNGVRGEWYCDQQILIANQAQPLTAKAQKNRHYPYDVLWGQLDPTSDRAKLYPTFPATAHISKVVQNLSDQKQVKGTTVISLFDKNGKILYSNPVEFIEDIDGKNSDFFVMLIPHHKDTSRMEISVDGKDVTSLKASPNKPSIPKINGLIAGQVIRANHLTLSWSAKDEDGDKLTGILQYSSDGGQTWQLIQTIRARQTNTAIDMTVLEGTTAGLFRIIISDGFNYTAKNTPYFAIPNRPPTVEIVSTEMKHYYKKREAISLKAVALDLEDGYLEGKQVIWHSDIAGHLGYDLETEVHLPAGSHKITLTATDNKGLKTEDKINVQVIE